MTADSRNDLETTVRGLQRKIEEYERWFRFLDTQNRRLEMEHQKLSAVVNGSDIGFAVIDRSMNIVWANNVFTLRFATGDHPGSVIGSSCCQVLCRREAPCASCLAQAPFSSGEIGHREMELVVGGRRALVYATAVPVKSPYGNTEETLLMLQDLTDLRGLGGVHGAPTEQEEACGGTPLLTISAGGD